MDVPSEIITIREEYQVLGYVDSGGEKDVYKVRQVSTGQILAMKRTIAKRSKDACVQTQVVREVKLLAQLTHPNIPPIYTAQADSQVPMFAERFIEGKTWARLIHDLPLKENVRLLLQVLDVMSWIHQKHHILHCDLKPGNVMLTGTMGKDWTFYIVDWSMAFDWKREHTVDELRLSGGTEEYMPPEMAGLLFRISHLNGIQYRLKGNLTPEKRLNFEKKAIDVEAEVCAQARNISPTTDIFTLGGILYHILTGRAPYATHGRMTTRYTLLKKRLQGKVRPIRRFLDKNSRCPQKLIDIAEKALAANPKNRFQSASEMAHELRAWLDSVPHFPPHKSKTRRDNIRTLTFATGTSLLLILSLSFFFLWNSSRTENQKLQKMIHQMELTQEWNALKNTPKEASMQKIDQEVENIRELVEAYDRILSYDPTDGPAPKF